MNLESGTHLIDSLFPYKVCINLDRRPERWVAMQDKFQAAGIAGVQRLPAIDGKLVPLPAKQSHLRPGDYGCTLSHMTAVRNGRDLGMPNVLIFEDDAFFDQEFLVKFNQYIAQLPADWDMLFLGGYHFDDPIPVSANIVKATLTLTTHAYAINHTIYDEFIALNADPPAVVDRNNATLQRRFACYCFAPNLVGQEAGVSDITDTEMPLKPLSYTMPIRGHW
jgi:glycosyl transferase family 25